MRTHTDSTAFRSSRPLRKLLVLSLLGSAPAFAGTGSVNGDFDADASSWILNTGTPDLIVDHDPAVDADNASGSGALAWSIGAGAGPLPSLIASQCVDVNELDPYRRFNGAGRIESGNATLRVAVEYFDGADCGGSLLQRQVVLSSRARGTWKRFRVYEGLVDGLSLPGGSLSAQIRLEVDMLDSGAGQGHFDALYYGPPRPQGSALDSLVDGFDYAIDPNFYDNTPRDAHGLAYEFSHDFADAGWVTANTSSPALQYGAEPGFAFDFTAFDGPISAFIGIPWQVADTGGHISYWVVSPELQFGADRACASLFTRASSSEYVERAQIRLSTAGASIDVGDSPATVGDFDTLLAEINPANIVQPASCALGTQTGYPREWCEVRVCGLPNSGSGRIAFRYFVADTSINGHYVGIDRFRFPAPALLVDSSLAITAESADPTAAGEPYQVSVAVTSAGGTPTGSVIVGDGVDSCVAALVDGIGSCTLASTAAGTRTLAASYAGDTRFASSRAQTAHVTSAPANGAASTVQILSHDPAPSELAGNYEVRVEVSSGTAAPTGQVLISEGDQSCLATLSNPSDLESQVQSASCMLASYVSGNRTLTATYLGDVVHRSSQAQTTHAVGLAGDAVTNFSILSHEPEPSQPNQPYTVVTSIAGNNGEVKGLVTISDGNDVCSAKVFNGRASCVLVSATPGIKTLTADYSGSSAYRTASTTASHTVAFGQGVATVAITADTPDPSRSGQDYVVQVSVTGNAGTPTGTVSVGDGSHSCQIALTAGNGQCTLSSTTIGILVLTANYSGDGSYAPATDTETHTVVSADRVFLGGFED